MAKHIVTFEGRTSHLNPTWDSRVKIRKLTAEVENVNNRGWQAKEAGYWVTIKENNKMLFTCKLSEWAQVMELFDKAVISVTGRSLEKMFGNE